MAEHSTSSRQVGQKQWREKFLAEISDSEMKKSPYFNVLLSDKYSKLIERVEDAEKSEKRIPSQQRRLKRFSVLIIGEVKKIIAQMEGNIKYYLQGDELYDVIDVAHVAVRHGGRDKMLAET
ncbi:hypothetical protein WA026_003871 [Henosepilachna vigintioctopunctata]|uniref:Uncharacterized protein n=1 Tax=Henosepilachna vigintioctopunctata TaxID=420089 RepID=A0AAW1U5Y5_9CUCU